MMGSRPAIKLANQEITLFIIISILLNIKDCRNKIKTPLGKIYVFTIRRYRRTKKRFTGE